MNARQTFDRAITIADNERRAADAARVAAEARAAAAAQVYSKIANKNNNGQAAGR